MVNTLKTLFASRDQHGIPDPMMYYTDQQNTTTNNSTTNSLWDEQVH